MKLYFRGHDYKYAAEQMLLTLFPDQRPEYDGQPPAAGEDFLVLSLSRGKLWATATARLIWQGRHMGPAAGVNWKSSPTTSPPAGPSSAF